MSLWLKIVLVTKIVLETLTYVLNATKKATFQEIVLTRTRGEAFQEVKDVSIVEKRGISLESVHSLRRREVVNQGETKIRSVTNVIKWVIFPETVQIKISRTVAGLKDSAEMTVIRYEEMLSKVRKNRHLVDGRK